MPSWLGFAAAIGMIVAGLAMAWFTWRRQAPRYYLLMAAGSIVGGVGWFMPSDALKALFALISAACWTPVMIILMITTWKSAKAVHAPAKRN